VTLNDQHLCSLHRQAALGIQENAFLKKDLCSVLHRYSTCSSEKIIPETSLVLFFWFFSNPLVGKRPEQPENGWKRIRLLKTGFPA